MNGQEWLAEQFEANRSHLRAVAYRMLGGVSEADDAVQETWIRLSRSDTNDVENLTGWLTTVVARVCLDMLRSRKSRREERLDAEAQNLVTSPGSQNPEHEAQLADSVGLALLVVLDTLTPAERLAFVLHDTFAVSFDEIGRIVGRSPAAARQLASRARRRIQGVTSVPSEDLRRQREIIDAFLNALRAGDFEGLLAVLDPDVVVHADPGAGRPGAPAEIRGARNWAQGAITFSRMARFLEPALVNGSVGLVFAPRGRLLRALSFRIDGGKIVEAEIIAKPERLQQLELSVVQ
jgi:RNA polymerase sigma-70 factor (ECF subfamily)